MTQAATASIGHNSGSVGQILEVDPQALFNEPTLLTDLETEIREQIEDFQPDLSTASSRSEIATLAASIARRKTAIDKAGMAMTEKWREDTADVNKIRSALKLSLDALRDLARRPLNEWEDRETAREQDAMRIQRDISAAFNTPADLGLEKLQATIDEWEAFDIPEELFGLNIDAVREQKDQAIAHLRALFDAATQRAADAAELLELRANAEAQKRAEDKLKAAQDALERQEAQAEQAEIDRKAEAEQAEARAEEQAARQAEEIAAAEARGVQAAEAAAAKLRQETEQAEAAAKAKVDAKIADNRHRKRITNKVAEQIVELVHSLGLDDAIKISKAIADGEIRNAQINF